MYYPSVLLSQSVRHWLGRDSQGLSVLEERCLRPRVRGEGEERGDHPRPGSPSKHWTESSFTRRNDEAGLLRASAMAYLCPAMAPLAPGLTSLAKGTANNCVAHGQVDRRPWAPGQIPSFTVLLSPKRFLQPTSACGLTARTKTGVTREHATRSVLGFGARLWQGS